MTKDEIKDIRGTLRDILEELDRLDGLETWDSTARRKAKDCLSDFAHYAERQKSYYGQYRGLMRD